MYKILFVCTGNICRSPTAHGVFEQLVSKAGLAEAVCVDSAGISDWHVGLPPDARSTQTALKNGVDITSQRARHVIRDDFKNFDLIIAMDRSHFQALENMRPAFSPEHDKADLKLMMDFAPHYGTQDVPDPYFGQKEGFQIVFNMIESASHSLLSYIQQDVLPCR